MRFLTEKIKKLNIGWNERRLTEVDFYLLCKRFKIKIQETSLSTGGFYFRVMGRDFIAVDSRAAGPQKLAIMFHELGHFLFHTPETGPSASFHGVGRRTRKEIEADIFALCALIPKNWIESRYPQELIDYEGLTAEMIASRYEILQRYGI